MISVAGGGENQWKLDFCDVITNTTSGANVNMPEVKFDSSISQYPKSVFRSLTHSFSAFLNRDMSNYFRLHCIYVEIYSY